MTKRIRVDLRPESQSQLPLIGHKVKLREWDETSECIVTAWENDPTAPWVVRNNEAYPEFVILVLEVAA